MNDTYTRMTTKIVTLFICAGLTLSACQDNTTTEATAKTSDDTIATPSEPASTTSTNPAEDSARLFHGSWVTPNPINNKEMQGFILHADSTAESINMRTLLYKKWWLQNGKLWLVSESMGNKVSSVDTIAYEVNTINNQELELKDRALILNYKKQ